MNKSKIIATAFIDLPGSDFPQYFGENDGRGTKVKLSVTDGGRGYRVWEFYAPWIAAWTDAALLGGENLARIKACLEK